MPKYPQDLIDRVAKATDLVKLVRQYVDLKPSGNSWVGLCPFHAEKTPSFHVHPERGYYCFGCHEGGRAFQFLMRMTGLSFPEAVKDLADRAGITLPEPTWSPGESRDKPLKSALYDLMEKAAVFYEEQLWSPAGRDAQRYLFEDRGVPPEVVKEFRLGLSPNRWEALRSHLSNRGHSDKAMIAAGLVKPRSGGKGHYDVFRHRLMIPVADPEGRVVAMAGRLWEEDPREAEVPGDPDRPRPRPAKYVNSPTTAIYEKGRVLYGLRQARPHVKAGGLIFLVEGYFDLISLVAGGVKPVAAVMGTALTAQQLSALRNMAREVHLVFDSDAAGEKATKRALPLLYNAGLDGRVIRLPDGHDPDSFVREFGARAFYELADEAPDIADYFADRLAADAGTTVTGASRMVSEAQQVLAQVPEGAQRGYLAIQLGRRLGLSPDLLGGPGGRGRGGGAWNDGTWSDPGRGPRDSGPGGGRPAKGAAEAWAPLAEKLLAHVITHPECLQTLEAIGDCWPSDHRSRRVVDALRGPAGGAAWRLDPDRLAFDDDERLSSLVSGALLSPRRMRAQEAVPAAREQAEKLKKVWDREARARLAEAVRKAEDAGDRALADSLLSIRPR